MSFSHCCVHKTRETLIAALRLDSVEKDVMRQESALLVLDSTVRVSESLLAINAHVTCVAKAKALALLKITT